MTTNYKTSIYHELDMSPYPFLTYTLLQCNTHMIIFCDSGLVVQSEGNGANGCIVQSITENEAVSKDGRLSVGDYLLSVNSESLKYASTTQAKAILRRAGLQSEIRYASVLELDHALSMPKSMYIA